MVSSVQNGSQKVICWHLRCKIYLFADRQERRRSAQHRLSLSLALSPPTIIELLCIRRNSSSRKDPRYTLCCSASAWRSAAHLPISMNSTHAIIFDTVDLLTSLPLFLLNLSHPSVSWLSLSFVYWLVGLWCLLHVWTRDILREGRSADPPLIERHASGEALFERE